MHTYTDIITPADWICRNCHEPRARHVFHEAVVIEGVIQKPERILCTETSPVPFARYQHEFVGMARVRNEASDIAEVLEAALTLCARVFVMDDHSTDKTVEICQRFGDRVTVLPSPFEGFSESRDKNWLLDQILRQCDPQWILCVDGDEVLEKRGAEIIRQHIAENPELWSWKLKILFFWNDRQTVRVDRIYDFFWRPSLFRPFIPRPNVPDDLKLASEFRFMATPFGRKRGKDQPNLHCSSVPQRLLHGCEHLPARLKHYGYLERAQRVAKLDRYTALDWNDLAEDRYVHIVQGDNAKLEELPLTRSLLASGDLSEADVAYMLNSPADARLLHAGPMEFAKFVE